MQLGQFLLPDSETAVTTEGTGAIETEVEVGTEVIAEGEKVIAGEVGVAMRTIETAGGTEVVVAIAATIVVGEGET